MNIHCGLIAATTAFAVLGGIARLSAGIATPIRGYVAASWVLFALAAAAAIGWGLTTR